MRTGQDARRGADLIKKIVVDGGPWLQKAVQDSALGVSDELNGAIDAAVVRASTNMLNATQKVTTDACSKINEAGADAVGKIKSGVVRALDALDLARKSLENEARQAGGETVDRWSNEVDRAVAALIENKSEIERATQRRRTILTIAVTIPVTLALFLGLWSLGRSSGYDNGYADGKQSSFDAKERADWANTPEGKNAHWLAQTGALVRLTTCVNPGWVIQPIDDLRLCVPKAASDGTIHGWYLPPS